jgi:hypothetical protein
MLIDVNKQLCVPVLYNFGRKIAFNMFRNPILYLETQTSMLSYENQTLPNWK